MALIVNDPTTVLKTVVIKAGETIIVPKDAVITSLVTDGSIDVTSTCDNLPLPEEYQCYTLIFSANEDASESPNLEDSQSQFTYLKVAGTQYDANISLDIPPYPSLDYHGPQNNITSFILGHVPQALFKLTEIYVDTTGARLTYTIAFKTVESVAPTIEARIDGPGFNGLFIKAAQINCA